MELWVLASVGAAFAQTARFALQKDLTVRGLGAATATYARFAFSAPVILAVALAVASQRGPPEMTSAFWAYAVVGGAAQIGATIAVVALFRLRAFAVGLALKKTEVMQTALVGWLILGDAIRPMGIAALAVGFVALLLLSEPPAKASGGGVALGLLSGALFAVSAVGYRGATLELAQEDAFWRALWTLAIVTSMQFLAMTSWFVARGGKAVIDTWRERRIGVLVGAASAAGSFGWFFAFSLQNAAYVFAVGQIELFFGMIASARLFGEGLTRREVAGLVLLAVSVIALVMLG
jgi:drug/metabolite transporter (DMT)-like permease